MNKKPKVISLFAGAGGMDLGFKQAGYDIVWANEFDEKFAETYRNNIGDHIVVGDIKKIKNSEIPNKADIVIGGFPCQGFSIANNNRKKTGMKDERNHLYKEMLRIIRHVKPKFFIAENVKGLMSIEKGLVLEMIINDFKKLGYNVNYKLLKASEYGVPQNRERVIIIGNRIGAENEFPKIIHGETSNLFDEDLIPMVTVKDSIGHLYNIRQRDKKFKLKGKTILNHVARTNVHDKFWGRKHKVNQHEICDYLKYWRNRSSWTTKKIDEHFGYAHTAGHWFRKDNNSGSIPNPEDWWELKKLLEFDDKFDKQVTELELKDISYEQSLRISNWDSPSDTITASGTEIHPNKKRRLSVREAAILQTFPDDFEFVGGLGNMYKQIGNAVPVLLAKKLALSLKPKLQFNNEIRKDAVLHQPI